MPDELAAVLLRRRRLVDAVRLTPPVRRSAWQWLRHPLSTQAGLGALQADLIQRGFLMSASLYRHCAGLSPLALAGLGQALLDLLDKESGENADHVPLFRGFPESVPGNTETFYIDRVFARLLQEPSQPCVLCGEAKSVHPVSPCAHLVCRSCWDGADLSACPLCLRRIDPDDPFLEPSFDEVPGAARADRLRLLALAPADAMQTTAAELLARQSPLSPADHADLKLLLADADETWLPDLMPVRETRAVVLSVLLPRYPHLINTLVDTATDALRFLYVLMDADPSLRTPPARRHSLPRPVRRAVLARLNQLPLEHLVDDLHRHQRAWKRLAENLHPFEDAARYPRAALAFAVLRDTRLTTQGTASDLADQRTSGTASERRPGLDPQSPAGRAVLRELANQPAIQLEGGRLRFSTFASRVEGAFTYGRPDLALDLLRGRPGELLRRLMQLARAMPGDAHATLVEAVTTAASDVSPVVLTAALGQVRTPPGDLRLFFPRGGTARIWTCVDEREPLPADLATALSVVLVGELLRRATALPRLRRAFLDEALSLLAHLVRIAARRRRCCG